MYNLCFFVVIFFMTIVQSVLAYWELKLSTSSQGSELRQACQKAEVK